MISKLDRQLYVWCGTFALSINTFVLLLSSSICSFVAIVLVGCVYVCLFYFFKFNFVYSNFSYITSHILDLIVFDFTSMPDRQQIYYKQLLNILAAFVIKNLRNSSIECHLFIRFSSSSCLLSNLGYRKMIKASKLRKFQFAISNSLTSSRLIIRLGA